MNPINDIFASFTTKENQTINLKIESFLWVGNHQHEVTVIFHYEFINKTVIYLMPLSLYEKCKDSYNNDEVKVIYHLPVHPFDIIEDAENTPFCPF